MMLGKSNVVNLLEIGSDNFVGRDLKRANLHKQRRIRCSNHLASYNLILYSKNINEKFSIEKESDNLTVYRLGGNRFLSFFKIYRLASKIIKSTKTDVISSIDPFTYGFIAYLLKIRFKIPFSLQIHFDYFGEYFWEYASKVSKLFNMSLAKIVIPGSDSMRVVSILHRERLENMGIKGELIEVIPTPVDMDLINVSRVDKSLCNKYRITPKTKLLLYVGRLDGQKDLTTLLKAFKLIKETYKEVRLLLIGSGAWELRLKKVTEELGISRDVLFLGSVAHDLVFSYYYGSDIFVISSESEGRPTVLTEAALSKKPIVTTRFLGTKDLILDGETGFIVDIKDHRAFSDRVLKLLNNPQMVKDFGEKGHVYVSREIEKINDIGVLASFWERTAKNGRNN